MPYWRIGVGQRPANIFGPLWKKFLCCTILLLMMNLTTVDWSICSIKLPATTIYRIDTISTKFTIFIIHIKLCVYITVWRKYLTLKVFLASEIFDLEEKLLMDLLYNSTTMCATKVLNKLIGPNLRCNPSLGLFFYRIPSLSVIPLPSCLVSVLPTTVLLYDTVQQW